MKLAQCRSSSSRWGVGFFVFFVAACGGKAQDRLGDEPRNGGSHAGSGGSPTSEPCPVAPRDGDAGEQNQPTPDSGAGSGGSMAEGGMTSAGGATLGGAAGAATAGAAGAPAQPPLPSCDPIVFEDPDVEFALRGYLNKPSGALHPADVVGLEFFSVSGVKSIRGVECLTALQSLSIGDLPFGSVTDLSPLASLNKLRELDIGRNPIASLEPLGKLPQLAALFASRIPVELDLTPLSTAPKLATLYLQADTVTDLKPLGGVATLRTLDFRSGVLVHPEGVSALTQLEDFDATSVFADVAPLAALTQLQKLRIPRKNIEHFADLKTLVNLRFLDISSTGITSISPVSHMPELVELVAAGNHITQTEPLGALTRLSEVILVDNDVVDLGPLVMNTAFGAGDFLYVNRNALGCDAQAINLQVLQARGVKVSSDCP